MTIDLNEDFKSALHYMNETDQHLFITGKAGTGKSTLLKYFKTHTKKKSVFLAPTGLAAVNIGGQTIHSFFGFPPRPFDKSEIRKRRNRKVFENLEVIVIDEVSMVRADILDGIDYFMRKNGPNPYLPFGGVQMIMIGDLFQLPPVVRDEQVQLMQMRGYASPFFFDSYALQTMPPHHIELKQHYRQSDDNFIAILNKIRNKTIQYEGLHELNEATRRSESVFNRQPFITLTSTNRVADNLNKQELAKIQEPSFKYLGEIKGEFDSRLLPSAECLELKKGAQVMFVRNDSEGRWVNGTIGKIAGVTQEHIKVGIKEGEMISIYKVEKEKWEVYKYEYNVEKQKIEAEAIGSFTQYPLRLAWAITIHKSQGMTFERVVINLGRGAFAAGQVYVALSRCTTLDGIVLKSNIRQRDIMLDDAIIGYAAKHGIL